MEHRFPVNNTDLIRQSLQQQLSDISDLLALRLVYPPQQAVVSIDQEILDLYTYPERLETSYRDEWKAIALKALYRHGVSDEGGTDEQKLEAYLRSLRDDVIPRCKRNNAELFDALEEILAIQRADNTITFPGPGRRKPVKRR